MTDTNQYLTPKKSASAHSDEHDLGLHPLLLKSFVSSGSTTESTGRSPIKTEILDLKDQEEDEICSDFLHKSFCLKGKNCPFSHGG